jgi:hypothetical protein
LDILVSERTGVAPGDMEIITSRDKLAAQREADEKSRIELRKRVLAFIRRNPGCTKNAVRDAIGSVAGIEEWLKDGIMTEKNFGLYAT